jgi:TRAP-type mannitol/chloroaromatic compound transport system substrate-binding protein
MKTRRKFMKAGLTASVGVTASALTSFPAPAIAQSSPVIRWRCTSSFPKSLDTVYGAGEIFCKAVAEATDNRFQIQLFAPGEIVPALNAADAVSSGTVECAHTSSIYYVGKDPTFAFGLPIPFALNSRMTSAWLTVGEGAKIMDDFWRKHNIKGFLCGNTGTQMGGWFRREVNSVADMQGLKIRMAGFAGQIVARLGATPVQIAGGDVYTSLERGTIDAAEWIGPYDDQKLGFVKVAPYYYYPGWHEGSGTAQMFINQQKWDELPPSYKSIVTTATEKATLLMQANYDLRNPPALKQLVSQGAQLRLFSEDVLKALYNSATEVYTETAAKNADFKKAYDSLVAFRSDAYLWWQVGELHFDNFMVRARRQG